MGEAARKLLEQTLRLSAEERGALAAVLYDSVDKNYSQEEIDAAWAFELQRRLDDVRAGRAKLVPWEQVDAELIAQFPRR